MEALHYRVRRRKRGGACEVYDAAGFILLYASEHGCGWRGCGAGRRLCLRREASPRRGMRGMIDGCGAWEADQVCEVAE